jgi:hypothetical protein
MKCASLKHSGSETKILSLNDARACIGPMMQEPASAPSNRRTRLCSSAAPGDQAHRQSLDSYYWEPEHAKATDNSKHHEGSS